MTLNTLLRQTTDASFGIIPVVMCQRCKNHFRVSKKEYNAPKQHKIHMNTSDEAHQELMFADPDQPQNPKHLRVGIIGMPNVGKSTLVNAMVGRQILATSSRIDTTQSNTLAILTSGDTQIEFQDTPGIHNKRKARKVTGKFQNAFLPGKCMQEADMCMVVADLSSRKTSSRFLQPEILLHLLRHSKVPSILVLNKIDELSNKNDTLAVIDFLTAGMVDGVPYLGGQAEPGGPEPISLPQINTTVFETMEEVVTKESASNVKLENKTEIKLLNQLRNCRGWPYFKEVFVISALKQQNIDKLKKYLMMKALSEPWKYHSSLLTDASPYDVVKNAMRSTLLENLAEEVPYYMDINISDWKEENNALEISVDLVCKMARHERFVERAIKILEFGAKRRLREVFPVNVKINAIVYNKKMYDRYYS